MFMHACFYHFVYCLSRRIERCICGNRYLSFPKLPPAKEVWGKVIFLHLSVILFTGGRCLLLGACSCGGAWSWGDAWSGGCLVWGGLSAPGGHLLPGGAWSQRAAWWRPPRRLLLRAVRILLECILVFSLNSTNSVTIYLSLE